MHAMLLGLVLAALTFGVGRAQDAAPAGPTAGDRVAASETTRKLKRLSDRMGAGVGAALGRAGAAGERAGDAVGGAFGTLDRKLTGWTESFGLKPRRRDPSSPGPGSDRDD